MSVKEKEKEKQEVKTLIQVNGLDIRANSVYKITNKLDTNAPDGFVNAGATKLPSMGIGNTVPCRFVNGVFDTGLYEQSPCYANMDDKEVKAIVKNLKNTIVIPFEKKWGQKGQLDNHNEAFWNDYGVNLEADKFLDTSKIDDLLGLYIAMRGFELTPKKLMGDPKFSDSQFCIEDKEVVKSIETERANEMMTAIGDFQALIKSNPSKLLNIFRYLGIIAYNEKVDNETLNAIGFTWFNQEVTNPRDFIKVYGMTETDETEEVVDLFVLVNKLYHNSTIERKGGSFYYKGEMLGGDLKSAARNLNSKKDLEKIKLELLEKN